MTIETAIKKAIEGGWKNPKGLTRAEIDFDGCEIIFTGITIHINVGDICIERIHLNDALLDPLFWQSLGKSLGWDEEGVRQEYRIKGKQVLLNQNVGWLYHWHRLVDSLAEGKSVEEFFETLK